MCAALFAVLRRMCVFIRCVGFLFRWPFALNAIGLPQIHHDEKWMTGMGIAVAYPWQSCFVLSTTFFIRRFDSFVWNFGLACVEALTWKNCHSKVILSNTARKAKQIIFVNRPIHVERAPWRSVIAMLSLKCQPIYKINLFSPCVDLSQSCLAWKRFNLLSVAFGVQPTQSPKKTTNNNNRHPSNINRNTGWMRYIRARNISC